MAPKSSVPPAAKLPTPFVSARLRSVGQISQTNIFTTQKPRASSNWFCGLGQSAKFLWSRIKSCSTPIKFNLLRYKTMKSSQNRQLDGSRQHLPGFFVSLVAAWLSKYLATYLIPHGELDSQRPANGHTAARVNENFGKNAVGNGLGGNRGKPYGHAQRQRAARHSGIQTNANNSAMESHSAVRGGLYEGKLNGKRAGRVKCGWAEDFLAKKRGETRPAD